MKTIVYLIMCGLILMSCTRKAKVNEVYKPQKPIEQQKQPGSSQDPSLVYGHEDQRGNLSFVLSKSALAQFSLDTNKAEYKLSFNPENGAAITKDWQKLEFEPGVSDRSKPITLAAKKGLKGAITMEVRDDKGTLLKGVSEIVTIGTNKEVEIKLEKVNNNDRANVNIKVKTPNDGATPGQNDTDDDSNTSTNNSVDLTSITDPDTRAIAQQALNTVPQVATLDNVKKFVNIFCAGNCHSKAEITSTGVETTRPNGSKGGGSFFYVFTYQEMPSQGSPQRNALDALQNLGVDYRQIVIESFLKQ